MRTKGLVAIAGISFSVMSLMGCSNNAPSQASTSNAPVVSPASQSPADSSTSVQTEQSPEATVLSSGDFVDGEHPTQGTVRIIEQDNQRLLELDSAFATSTSGPDLVVILHRSSDVIGSTVPPAYPLSLIHI